MDKKYTIAVAGTGYVGLSIATLLSQHHKVYAVDIVQANMIAGVVEYDSIRKHLAECAYHTVEIREKYYL